MLPARRVPVPLPGRFSRVNSLGLSRARVCVCVCICVITCARACVRAGILAYM